MNEMREAAPSNGRSNTEIDGHVVKDDEIPDDGKLKSSQLVPG